MMPREWEQRIKDIVEACLSIKRVVTGISYEEFIGDFRNLKAVCYDFIVIGEAVKDLPGDILKKFPDVNWRRYARFRDVLTHRYFDTSAVIVWEAAKDDVDLLLKAAQKLI